jgi:hypothetical protein
MLSFTKTPGARKIARVKGGEHDKEYVYLDLSSNDTLKYLDSKFFAKLPKTMAKKDLEDLREAIITKHAPENDSLLEYWRDAMFQIKIATKNGIRLRNGKLIPLPDKKTVEKLYISGPSGSGKSTFASMWLGEYLKMYKDDPVYVFSSVGYDAALDKYDVIRVPLDASVAQLQPQDFAESVTIWDDIDTITNAKVRKAVCALRDEILEIGRHYEIRMLCTSHIIANYASTRRLLNEATSVTFFPSAGSTFHIKRFLQHYGGLSKSQIDRILSLPSRWIVLYKTFPMLILYSKGCYMLCED